MGNPSRITHLDDLRALYGQARERSTKKELRQLDAHAKRWIALSPFVVLATGSPDSGSAGMDASPRGGEAGFVKVLDDQTLLLPDAPGNNRLDSLENIVRTGQVGLLFLVPGADETLRVNGRAELSTSEADLRICTDTRRTPNLVIRVTVQAVYLHCGKALIRSALWDSAKHVDRSQLPSMGEMLRDQIAHLVSPDMVFENQAQMLVRYQESL